jgi:hypothetical protein
MRNPLTKAELNEWCKIIFNHLENNPAVKILQGLVKDSLKMV